MRAHDLPFREKIPFA